MCPVEPSGDQAPSSLPSPPPLPPDDLLARSLGAHPQDRAHVFWSEQHGGWAMPAWLGDVLRLWVLAQVDRTDRH